MLAVSPRAKAISLFASLAQTMTAISDGVGPAGSGARVVGEVVGRGEALEHPAPVNITSATTAMVRARTMRQYQRPTEGPGQLGWRPTGGSSIATSSTCSVMGK